MGILENENENENEFTNAELTEIEKILENQKNEDILKLDSNEIYSQKKDIIEELCLVKSEEQKLLKKLKNYRLIENLNDILIGAYIRSIHLKNPDLIKLNSGGLILDIQFNDNPIIILKNNLNKIFQIDFNRSIIFQKFSQQEEIILQISDYINN